MNTFCRTVGDRAAKALLYTSLVITFVVSPAAFAQNGEDIFQKASFYTVQIRTTIDMPFTGEYRSSSMGAGFVVDTDRGWIMTNAHVAARSPSQVWVKFQRGEYHKATKVYVDPYLDLAILELDESQRVGLVAAELDCEGIPPVGHPVGAFGHPWNLAYTGTRGIISGVTSRIGTEMLQTDAPINGGNSGGPLFSLGSGKIVGLSTASIDSDEDQNTNFAVPMKYACHVLRLLQAGKDPSPPQLSVVFYEDLDDDGNLTVAQTYLANDSLPLKVGDTINAVAGASDEIRNEGQLVHALRGRLDDLELEVTRAGKLVTLSGHLEPAARITERSGVFATGILIAPMNLRDGREISHPLPLMVHSVEFGSLGESLEIETWDMLVSVNGHPIETLDSLYARLGAAQDSESSVMIVFKRWSDELDRVYDYVARSIPIEYLEFVGPSRLDHVATRN